MKRILALSVVAVALCSCGGSALNSQPVYEPPPVEYIHPSDLG